MKRNLAVIFCLSLITFHLSAQSKEESTVSSNNSWSVGVHAGLMSPYSIIFLPNKTHTLELNVGYGLTLTRQLNERLDVFLNFHRGRLSDKLKEPNTKASRISFDTEIAYVATANTAIKIVTLNAKKWPIRLNGNIGLGVAAYAPSYVTGQNVEVDLKNHAGKNGDKTYFHAAVLPVGLALQTKLSDKLKLNADYTVYVLDADNVDGPAYKGRDRWSYASLGLAYTLAAGK